MKINCVVVTYNRLELLKENLNSLLNQTYGINRIFVIDNNSSDGTDAYLEKYRQEPSVKVVRLKENIGGAGGFSYGIRCAVEDGCDWVWIMDDDTIPNPDALEKLVKATSASNDIGFICSKVIWKDNTPHKMNMPGLTVKKCGKPFNYYSGAGPFFLINGATFVSLLINKEAVIKVGLPFSDFFIWHDDIEYTSRMYKSGFIGLYVDNSIVLHNTAENYYPHLDTAPVESAWKFYYQIRNTIFMKRQQQSNKFIFWLSVINKYRICMHRLNKRKDGNKRLFKKYIVKGFKDGIHFHPKIEYLN